ncbi:MAG TPA: ELWxxDGT repeat protein [Thermoanaerobaculia bacterium]|nr:ELWxxDGT repeat protein [Thermoanaerobaculia bacterium]
MKRLALLALLAAPLLHAQTAYLVKDINTITSSSPTSSSPHGFFRFGSRIFFNAAGTAGGFELWSSDGTAAGTSQLLDICSRCSSNPSRFIELNGKLLFNANDSTHGEELWVSDGTAAGTHLLADIYPGSNSSTPGDRIVYHGKMIFEAQENLYGPALWITDGTPGGTQFLKDLGIPHNSGLPGPNSLVLLNDTVYFAAYGGLWKTDGTADGTMLVTSLAVADSLFVAGSRLFFAGPGQQTWEPWVSDGTAAGTHSLGAQAAYPRYFTAFGGGVLFDGSGKLWFSDGTTAGTRLVRDFHPGQSVTISGITAAGNIAYVAAGPELWRTDGTVGGTTLVKVVGNYVSDIVVAGNKIGFVGGGTGNARSLWVSDGTAAGTQPVRPAELTIHPVPNFGVSTTFPLLTNIDGTLWFSGANKLNGDELWTSDGTEGGTSMLLNLAADDAPSSFPIGLTAARDLLYFNAWDGLTPPSNAGDLQRALWRSDGTAAGTMKLSDQIANNGYTAVGRSIVFTTFLPNGNQLWSSDGTPEGTGPDTALASRFPQTPSGYGVAGDRLFAFAGNVYATTAAPGGAVEKLPVQSASWLTDVGGRTMFFELGFPFPQANLWITDGTAAGTQLIAASLPDVPGSAPVVSGGTFFFQIGSALWKSDGTAEGTVIVKSGLTGGNHLVAAGRKLFFTSGQLWVSDGTESGTHSLPATPLRDLAAVGESVVFAASDSTNGNEPWVSDGTPEGTHILLDIIPGAGGSFPTAITSAAGAVYFTTLPGLWMTDGTAVGTKQVAAVQSSLTLQQLVQAGDRLYFTPTTAETGQELWAFPLPSTRLSVNDTRVAEGDAGTTNARFTVTLSSPAASPVTVDYATSDGTAHAGSDYDAVSGTLTFAAGETSKTIDVAVHGDTTPANNRTFFVTLRNAAGAVIEKPLGFAIIDDDDQPADLALALDFSNFGFFPNVAVKATNNGPRSATNLTTSFTATPDTSSPRSCNCTPVPLLAPGASATVFNASSTGTQQYATVTATARQRDPQLSNNSVGWTSIGSLAMDALDLTPGGHANLWLFMFQSAASVSVTSSDPAVVSVPSSVAVPTAGKGVSFVVTGVGAGTATVHVFGSSFDVGTISVTVVAPGTKPRWPGGVNISANASTFDMPATVTVETFAAAPFTGEHATGLVTVTEGSRELGRVTLTGAARQWSIPFYLGSVGAHSITINYAGDANFLPVATTSTVTADLGLVTISASQQRSGTTATIHVTVTGSPLAVPTGSVTLTELGVIPPKQAPLTQAGGVAVADFTVTNLSPGVHTLAISYSGDAHYRNGVQDVRLPEPRRRAAGH